MKALLWSGAFRGEAGAVERRDRSLPSLVQMRQCPTLEGDDRPLIAHTIGPSLCLSRQRGFYHKCHRCVYRGKPADFSLNDEIPHAPHLNGSAREGAARRPSKPELQP